MRYHRWYKEQAIAAAKHKLPLRADLPGRYLGHTFVTIMQGI